MLKQTVFEQLEGKTLYSNIKQVLGNVEILTMQPEQKSKRNKQNSKIEVALQTRRHLLVSSSFALPKW